VDGAVLSRFPIGVLDVPPGLEPRWPTFGIKLGAAPGPVSEVHDTKTMSWAVLNTMTGFYDRMHIDDAAAAARTIVIDTGTVRATDFDLDRDTQDLLFRQGRQAAMKFLDGASGQPAWDWETYKRTHRNSSSPAANAAKPARDALRSVRRRLHRRAQHVYRTPTGPVIGFFNLLDGIAALANSHIFIGNAHYVVGDLRAWGWVMTIFGAVQLLAALGVWAGNQLARWFAVAVVGLNAIGQMFFIPAYPFWSLMIIAVDIVALWGLYAYGSRENLGAA